MSAAVLRENRKLQEQVIKMMAMSFTQPTMKCIKRLLMKKNASYFTDHVL